MSQFSGTTDSNRLANYVLGRFDVPAYAQRARATEEAYDRLLAECHQFRRRLLAPVQECLASLQSARNSIDAGAVTASDWAKTITELELVFQAQRLIAEAHRGSKRQLRRRLRELSTLTRDFNTAWFTYLHGLDLAQVNRLRDGYNRFYLLEKECAMRSAKLARVGYEPLTLLTVDQLLEMFPLLPVPHVDG